MNPQTQQLFIILVHYGSANVTERSLAALLAGSVRPTKIIVIDHGSAPLPAPAGSVQVIRPPGAAGYAEGVNLGLGALLAHGVQARDIVVAMNNDVEVYPETLAELLKWWLTQAAPGLVGAMVAENNQVVHGGGSVRYLTGRAHLQYQRPAPLQYIHGAFVAAAYETWLTLHGMPEQYFLYWEDVLLGLLARRRGYRVQLAPPVRVRHHAAISITAEHLYYLVRNGAHYLERELTIPWRWGWYGGNRLRYLWHRLQKGATHRVVAVALRDAMAGEVGKLNRPLP